MSKSRPSMVVTCDRCGRTQTLYLAKSVLGPNWYTSAQANRTLVSKLDWVVDDDKHTCFQCVGAEKGGDAE